MPRTNLRDSVKPEMLAPGHRAKIIARNTFKFTAPDGAIVTRLHNTDIVRALPGGRYQLNSGGWRTSTTKDRMGAALPGYRLYANKGSWYVAAGELGTIPYYDGMILPDAFKKPDKGAAAEKKEQSERAALRKFVSKIDKLDALPLPSNGDCWLCCLHDAAGKSMGEHGDDAGHLRQHIKEGYLHGSLLVNAMRWAGYQDMGIRYWLNSKPGQRSQVKSALRRYLYRKLGLAA